MVDALGRGRGRGREEVLVLVLEVWDMVREMLYQMSMRWVDNWRGSGQG